MSRNDGKPPAPLLSANGGVTLGNPVLQPASPIPTGATPIAAVQRDPDAFSDPLIISGVTFLTPVTIGGYAHESWSVQGSAQNQYHGKTRVEECLEGVRFFYLAGAVYEERTVYAAAIADVCRIPLSRLSDAQKASWEKAQKEIRR